MPLGVAPLLSAFSDVWIRLGRKMRQQRRLGRLRGTPATSLNELQIDCLELLDIVKPLGINVAFDIGANSGAWTLLMQSVIPGCRIEAFEPLDRYFDWNIPGTTFHPVALGSFNGKATLRITNFADASSFLPLSEHSKKHFALEETAMTTVPVARLDDYRKDKGLPLPDLLKLDVQGYEFEVLQGARECLASAKAVICEVAFVPLYEGQHLFHDLVALLAGHGLIVTAMGMNTVPGARLLYSDVLFLKRS